MKKNYVMLAFATLMMAACANNDLVDEVVKEEVPQAIGFETFSNKISRQVTAATALNSYHDAFGVWAYKTVGNLTPTVMDNYKVKYTETETTTTDDSGTTTTTTTDSWEYATVDGQSLKYWDKQATNYKFYAYAPYVATPDDQDEAVVTISADGKISIVDGEYAANENLQSYIVDDEETGFTTTLNSKKFTGTGATATNASTDWMIADAETVVTTKFGETVEEEFKHIMSKLIVILKSDDVAEGAEVEVTDVSINNVYGSGSYDGTSWTKSGDLKSIPGLVGKLESTNGYYSMEYLLIPYEYDDDVNQDSKVDYVPTFSITYEVNGDKYTVNDAKITGIDKFEANTCYTLTATIGLEPIVFTASAVDFTGKTGSVTIQ